MSFPAKYLKKLPETFVETAESMKEEDIRKQIVQCEGNISTVEKAKEDDEKLNGAKSLVKDLAAPYNETKACENAKIRYLIYVLEGRGVNFGGGSED